jgi:hypothetical protein
MFIVSFIHLNNESNLKQINSTKIKKIENITITIFKKCRPADLSTKLPNL